MNVKADLKGLEEIIKVLKLGAPSIKVGILGKDRSGEDGEDGGDNATVGTAHEYGTSVMPQRSFIRMPLEKKFLKEVQKSGFLEKEFLNKLKSEKSFVTYANILGNIAVETIRMAFDTGGFGTWAKWKNPDYSNNTGQILLDTQQLRNSVTFKVGDNSND